MVNAPCSGHFGPFTQETCTGAKSGKAQSDRISAIFLIFHDASSNIASLRSSRMRYVLKVVIHSPTRVGPRFGSKRAASLKERHWRINMAKKKAAVKKVGGKVVGKKKGKRPRALRPDLLVQNSSAYVVFDDATKTGGGLLQPVVITVRATAKDCNNAPVSIANFGFDATYNTVQAYAINATPTGDPSVATLEFRFYPWADDINTFFDEELVITVLTKKSVRVRR